MSLAWVLTALAALSGALHVRAEYRGPRRRVYLFKPLTVVLILVLALTAAELVSARYQAAIVGAMRVPVVGYVVVIVVMAWQAAARAAGLGSVGALLAAAGAALFVLSDAALAVNRFRRPFRAAQAVILPTYYAAQLLIAWSVGVPPR